MPRRMSGIWREKEKAAQEREAMLMTGYFHVTPLSYKMLYPWVSTIYYLSYTIPDFPETPRQDTNKHIYAVSGLSFSFSSNSSSFLLA